MDHDWLLDEIATGLQKLSLLSLDRTPAAENLRGTALAWFEALTIGRDWNESRDLDRVISAFSTLAQTMDRWPAPKHFIAALPDSTQLRIEGAGERPADPEWMREHLQAANEAGPDRAREELDRWLTDVDKKAERKKPRAKRKGPSLQSVEKQLQDHYSGIDRKTLAAGGE